MKKITLAIAALTLIFTSCSKDDSNENSDNQDKIIGTWLYETRFENATEIALDDCEKKDTRAYASDGSFSFKFHENSGNSCNLDDTETGRWAKDGNNYRFTDEVETYSELITFENGKLIIIETYNNKEYKDVYRKL